MRAAAFALLSSQVVDACFTLDGVIVGVPEPNKPEQWTKQSLREDGNVWDAGERGCNKLPCGSYLNDKVWDGPRIKVPADDAGIKIKAHLNQVWEGGHFNSHLMYGNNPNFAKDKPFDLAGIVVSPEGDPLHVYETIVIAPGYNHNATLQIEYVTQGRLPNDGPPGLEISLSNHTHVIYYQCIDIEVVDGQPFPDGTVDLGVDWEETLPPSRSRPPAAPLVKNNAFFLVAMLTGILAALFCCIAIILAIVLRKPKAEKTPIVPDVEPEAIQVKAEPVVEVTPTPTPPEPKEEPEEEVVGHIQYKEVSKKEVVEELPKQDSIRGSEGRHFHFRYINDGEQGEDKPN